MPRIKAGSININYEIVGEGEPLLLIMGFMAPGAACNQVEAGKKNQSATRFGLILLFGRGKSSKVYISVLLQGSVVEF